MLSSVVLASLNSARAKARDARRQADLNQIATALEFFYDKNGHYTGPEVCGHDTSIGGDGSCNSPSYSSGSDWPSNSDLRDLVTGGFMPALPVDPINNSTYYYRYEIQNTGSRPQDYALCARLEGGGFIWKGQKYSGSNFNGSGQPNPEDYCDAVF